MGSDSAPPPAAASPPAPRGLRNRLRRLGRDYLYILPGLPLAVVSFALLVPLTVVSLGTLVVWVGALLMPLTLLLASTFAGLSRRRLQAWGLTPAPVQYRPARRGAIGVVGLMADPRRWLDLAFETVFAFPLRLITFVIGVTWTGIALGGLTQWTWWHFVPVETSWPMQLLSLASPQLVPQSDAGVYLVDTGVNFVLGVLVLLTLPAVVHGLAGLDAWVTNALLSGQEGPRHGPEGERDPASVGSRPATSPGTRWVWAGTSFVALVLFIVAGPVLAALYGVHPAVAMLLAIGPSAAAVLAVRWPWAGIGVSTIAVVTTMVVTSAVAAGLPWPWPVTAMLSQFLLVIVLGLWHPWYWATGAWSAGTLLTALALVVAPVRVPGGLANGVVLVSITAAFTLLGILGRLWREGTARVQHAEELSAEEAQRRRDLEERNRIARELHDVVAHSMSVISVQASTAQYRKAGIDESVQQEFDDIADSSRQALAEMRSLLAVLRSDDDVPTTPVPALGDIPDLVESARASGATITDSIQAKASATIGLTAYRIVQEALSNALRHAPGAAIEVTAIDSSGDLIVEIRNSPPQGGAAPAPGSGLGLAGIRERAGALGGTVEAGATPAGGFCVTAVLPMDRDETT